MRGRPQLFTSYAADQAPLNTRSKRAWFVALIALLLVLPFQLGTELNALMATAFLAAIGAIGLNIVTGWAGQVSLGHAFFLGIGAYTGAALAGDPGGRVTGLGLDMWVWLPASGLVRCARGPRRGAGGHAGAGPVPGDRDARSRLPRRAPVPGARGRHGRRRHRPRRHPSSSCSAST